MDSAHDCTRRAASTSRKPMECLLRKSPDQLSPVMIYRLTVNGFDLEDVKDMLALSDLYSTKKIMGRIVDKPIRPAQRQGNKQPKRLNSRQSAVAFQYAKVLEHATNVFGTQKLAEEWLGRPCRYLDGDVPLDVIVNPVGFLAVSDYLERIEFGVYQ
ncbi:antitoxin Xre/MbcA/ParS toxin-binding domain-containing protein [Stutzerimonas frequens]|uniref:antitoxin Xre/MbcA/ParS toxin-binding domain-containing protein n=1 Tax=Stutzerimonas frequens TaxID=2968969 RepID=UPI0037478E0F